MKKGSSKIFTFLICVMTSMSVNANTYDGDSCYDLAYTDDNEFGYCGNFYVDAEFLYWKANENDLPFATAGLGTTVEGNVKEVNWS